MASEKQRKVGRMLTDLEKKKIAKRNATDSILSTSARHQAQQRAEYITENGLDREDAQLSREELNRNIGAVQTRNLYRNRKSGVRDYVAERAAQKTKARKNAVSAMSRVDNEEYAARFQEHQDAMRAIRKTGENDRKGLQQKRAKKW